MQSKESSPDKVMYVTGLAKCKSECEEDTTCESIDFSANDDTGSNLCQFFSAEKSETGLKDKQGYNNYKMSCPSGKCNCFVNYILIF